MSDCVHACKDAPQVIVQEPDKWSVDRDVDPIRQLLDDQVDEPFDRDRGQTENDDVRESMRVGHTDRVGVAGPWWVDVVVGCYWLEGPPIRFDHPLDLFSMWNLEVRKPVGIGHPPSVPQRLDLRCHLTISHLTISHLTIWHLTILIAADTVIPVTSPLLYPRMLLFHVVCAAAVVAMVNLSLWQFDRLDDRRMFNARVANRSALAIVDIADIDLSDPATAEWRRIGAVGKYRVEDEVLVLNRSQGGRAGVNVVTPLQLDGGPSILVVRGFLPLDAPVPPPPSGRVAVIGTAKLSDARRSTDLDVAEGRVDEFFRLDVERIDLQIEVDLVPIALIAEASDPPEDPSLQPVAKPQLSEGSHLSYAIQWLIFATAVVVGWILASRRTIKTKGVRTRSRSLPSA